MLLDIIGDGLFVVFMIAMLDGACKGIGTFFSAGVVFGLLFWAG